MVIRKLSEYKTFVKHMSSRKCEKLLEELSALDINVMLDLWIYVKKTFYDVFATYVIFINWNYFNFIIDIDECISFRILIDLQLNDSVLLDNWSFTNVKICNEVFIKKM